MWVLVPQGLGRVPHDSFEACFYEKAFFFVGHTALGDIAASLTVFLLCSISY